MAFSCRNATAPRLPIALWKLPRILPPIETFSRNAAESVRENFEQARSIARLEGFYRELIN